MFIFQITLNSGVDIASNAGLGVMGTSVRITEVTRRLLATGVQGVGWERLKETWRSV